jgi:hypothetical protein
MNNEDLLKKLNELFGSYRAEWLKGKIFDFFAEPSYFAALKDYRPCVLQGGRGTGKTTVLRGLSYQGQFALHEKSIKQLDDNNFIGIYHRVNTNHVRAFVGGGLNEEEWQRIFGHYFNLIICREILLFISWHKKLANNDENISSVFCNRIAKSMQINNSCESLESLLENVETTMYEFQAQINNISCEMRPFLSMAGDPIKLVIECAVSLSQFKNKTFYILIDEYENFTEYQQKCINSLIKHNSDSYTFKIGVRELGWKTRNTLNEQESLTDPADFVIIDIEQQFNDGSYFNEFAKNVCQQRIKQLFLNDENKEYSIETAFEALSLEEEALKLDVKKTFLFEKYEDQIKENKEVIRDISLLYLYFMVYWAENHKKKLGEIVSDYQKNKLQWDERYENYRYSMLFKIRKGRGMSGIQKFYAGWDTYIKLAHGNIRYLMELVYRAYEKHLTDNNIFSPISPENQTKTAQEIGMKNLIELEGLCKNGAQLTRLLLGFGRLFNVLISGAGKTAPEINQFSIKGKISQESNEILRDAVMHLACIRIPGNKPSSKSTIKEYMYALHPIYAPFFVFSYRRKRKIELFDNDFLGMVTDTSKYIKKILKRKKVSDSNIDVLPEQLDLFREVYDND